MEPERYIYFVSYAYQGIVSGRFGWGNQAISSTALINDLRTIADIQNQIVKSDPEYKTVVVLNYQLLRTE